jgi:hypothetical protein
MGGYGLDSSGLGQESVVSSCDKLSYSTQIAEVLSCSQAGLCYRKPANLFWISLQKSHMSLRRKYRTENNALLNIFITVPQ